MLTFSGKPLEPSSVFPSSQLVEVFYVSTGHTRGCFPTGRPIVLEVPVKKHAPKRDKEDEQLDAGALGVGANGKNDGEMSWLKWGVHPELLEHAAQRKVLEIFPTAATPVPKSL
jgi:hypothetical protein